MPETKVSSKVTFFVNRDKVLEKLPKSANDILFVGDSEVQGFEVAEFFSTLNAKNRGIYYETSGGVLHRTYDLAKGKPAKVFIEIGLNDLQKNIAIDSVANNLNKSLSVFATKSPTTKIYLLSVIPSVKVKDSERMALNILYRQLQSDNVTFIDLDPYFLSKKGLQAKYDVGDGIHLNGAGYRKLAEVLKSFVI
jgi:lysophospholipase L1-like esterase